MSKTDTTTLYTTRCLYRVVLEATTPIAVGSGEKTFFTDAAVALDVNGLPYIPGTSLTGVIHHLLDESKTSFNVDDLFGFQKGDKGKGSRVIISEAKVLNSKGEVCDGLLSGEELNDPLLQRYRDLPIRQHVRINDKGTHEDGGKFDNQVVFAGSRFCFEMEVMLTENENTTIGEEILQKLKHAAFRLGSGTRNGLGKVEVVKAKQRVIHLKTPTELDAYLKKSSSLRESDFWGADCTIDPQENSAVTLYKLELQPDDFFLFGSGMGDEDADMNSVREGKIVWKDNKAEFKKERVLIPASSVKGALSHRVAYHYNKINGAFVGSADAKVGNENKAVQELFGYENQDDKIQTCGKLLFSDVILDEDLQGKILNHVAIDRFTGGAIDGALFAEQPIYGKKQPITLEITQTAKVDEKIENALKLALRDICNGMLPLGGGVNRGHGIFTGKLFIN